MEGEGQGNVAGTNSTVSSTGVGNVAVNANDIVFDMEGNVPKQKMKQKFSFGKISSSVGAASNSIGNRQQLMMGGINNSRANSLQSQRGIGLQSSGSNGVTANGIIEKVFLNVSSQNKLFANIKKVDESLWGHLYVRNKLTGGEGKKINEDMQHGIKCVFGVAGSVLTRFLYRITWVRKKRLNYYSINQFN